MVFLNNNQRVYPSTSWNQILKNLSSWNPLVGTPNYHGWFSPAISKQLFQVDPGGSIYYRYIYIYIYNNVYIGDILLTCIPSISLLYHHFVWFYITISGYVFRFIPLFKSHCTHSYPCFIDIYIYMEQHLLYHILGMNIMNFH